MKLVRLIKMCLNEACNKICIGKHLSVSFHVQNGLKQGDALSSQFLSVAIQYAIRKGAEENIWTEDV
jgi:hypothetical protein